jgi:hypothetical protein
MEDIFAVAKEAGRPFPGLSLLAGFDTAAPSLAAATPPPSSRGEVIGESAGEAFAVAPLEPHAPPRREDSANIANNSGGSGGRNASLTAGFTPQRAASLSGNPAGVVGIRPPQNPHRTNVSLHSCTPDAVASSSTTCTQAGLYEYYAAQFQIKPNSRVSQILRSNATSSPNVSFSPSLLLQLTDVTVLNLSMCAFKDRGLLPILEILRHLPKLQSLILSSNDLSNDGVEWLAHALSLTVSGDEMTTLLAVTGTSLTAQEAAMRFVCPVLSELDLSNNKIGIGGTRLLSDLANLRSSLLVVKLDGIKIDASERRRLDRFLQANKAKTSAALR